MECHKPKHCLRKVSAGSGEFFGTPFEYSEDWMGCYLCKRETEHQEFREDEDEDRGERIDS